MKNNQKQKSAPGGIKAFFGARRFRYGSAAAALTATVVALVIIFNIIFGVLANRFRWYPDMTEEDVYGVSDASVEAIQAISSRFEIIFCAAADQVASNSLGNYVQECAKNYENKLDNVSLRYLNVANPADFENFTTDAGQTMPTTDSVIVAAYPADAPEDAKPSSFRKLSFEAFFTVDSDTNVIYAFSGEYKFTVTMLGLTGDKPTVYFSDGHGEDNGEETAVYQLFEDAGYTVKVIDLAREALVDEGAVLVIADPKKDFGAWMDDRDNQDGTTTPGDEVTRVANFINDYRGNLIVFADPVKYDLPNLAELIALRGVSFADTSVYLTDSSNAIDANGQYILAQYPTSEGNLSHELLPENISIKTIVPQVCPVYVSGVSAFPITDTDDYQWTVSGQAHTISPMLLSSGNAKLGNDAGSQCLMSLTATVFFEKGESDTFIGSEYDAFTLVCGAPAFLDNVYLQSNAFANRDILYSLLLGISSHNGSLKNMPDILNKNLTDETLTITTRQADIWTAVCVGVLPLAASICGIVVYVRRKHL